MYKNPINAYKDHTPNIQLDKRSEHIIAKAKRYNIQTFQNPNLAKNLLTSKPINTDSSKSIIELFTWLLECEAKTQMSKET